MTTAADGSKILLGRGKIYFDRLVSGAATGRRFLGECSQLEITPSVEKTEIYDHTKAAATKLASNVTRQTHKIAITMQEYDPENVALALMGTTAAVTQTTGSVTDESLTASVKKGRIYQTANRGISAVTVKKAPSTSLVLGTDYEIEDATLGLIRILPGSSTLSDGDAVTVSYTKATLNLTKVSAGSVGQILGALVFVGDPTNGPAYDAEIWRVDLSPSGALALISDEYASMALEGEILNDAANHPSDPLYRMTLRA